MSTLTINGKEISISTDSRFHSWAKISNVKTIDLSRIGGYRFVSSFESKSNWDFMLDAGDFVLLSSETGSRAHHYPTYYLFDSQGNDVSEEATKTELKNILKANPNIYTKEEYNNCQSNLGVFALWIVVKNRLQSKVS